MSEPTDTTAIVFNVVQLKDMGEESGFYWTIPTGEEEAEEAAPMHLKGPYPDEGAASQAAIEFIEDALTSFGPINQENENGL